MIYLYACIYFICDDTRRTDRRKDYSLWRFQAIDDLIHGLNGKSWIKSVQSTEG